MYDVWTMKKNYIVQLKGIEFPNNWMDIHTGHDEVEAREKLNRWRREFSHFETRFIIETTERRVV